MSQRLVCLKFHENLCSGMSQHLSYRFEFKLGRCSHKKMPASLLIPQLLFHQHHWQLMSQCLSWGHLGLHYRSSLSHSVSQQHLCLQYHQRLCWGMSSWWVGWSYSQSLHAWLHLQHLSLRRWLNSQLRIDMPWFPWPLRRPHQLKMRLDLSQLSLCL